MQEGVSPSATLISGEFDPRALVRLMIRRRWVVLSVFLVSLAVTIGYTLNLTPIYRAHTRVLIETHTPNVLSDDVREVYALGTPRFWDSQTYQLTQFELIKGRPVAQKVVASLGIDGPILAERVRNLPPPSLASEAAADPTRDLPVPLQEKLDFLGIGALTREGLIDELSNFDAVSWVRGRVGVESISKTNLADVSVTDPDPKRAAMLANAVTDAYLQVNLDQKIELSASAVEWLSDQVRSLKQRLKESELALHEFKQENNIVSVSLEDRQSMISQSLTALNAQLSDIKARRIQKEAVVSQLRTAKDQAARGEAELLDVVELMDGELIGDLRATRNALRQEQAEMLVKYTAEHPKRAAVERKLSLVEKELTRSVENAFRAAERGYRTLRDNENRLQSAFDELKAEALQLNKKEIDYNRLKRETDHIADLYKMVLKREKEVNLTRMLKSNNVRVVEPALVPAAPIYPKTRVNVIIGALFGLLLGFGLAFIVDYLDNTIKSQQDIEQLVGLPFLGVLPLARAAKDAPALDHIQRDLFGLNNPRSSLAECARSIRTNLMFMSPGQPAKIILVTSSGPKEGKSTVSVNLSLALAQSGNRTLLIDADMRRPRLHRTFHVDNSVGLSSSILGETEVERAAQSSGITNLDVLTCGPVPPNPAELLHTESFMEIMRRLSQRYSRVIVDSPPVGAVTDGLVLSAMADGTILVCREGKTSWQAALQVRRRLEDVGAKILGAVLNSVDFDRADHAYYYQYYQYYGRGYSSEDDGASERIA